MGVVQIEPSGITLAVDPGETVIEAAWRSGYRWPTVCYGQTTCGVCRFEVLEGGDGLEAAGDEERARLDELAASGVAGTDLRLACRALVTGTVTVRKDGVRVAG